MADLGPRARRGASPRWRLPLFRVGLIALTAAGAWWLSNEPLRARAPLARDAAPTPPARSGAATTAMATATAPSVPGSSVPEPFPAAARILEDPAAPGGPAVAVAAVVAPVAVAGNPFATPPAAVARAAHPRPAAPAARHRPAAAVAPPPSRAASVPRRAIDTVEPDLLATLLGNISRATPAEPRVGATTRPPALSGLIRPQHGSDQDALDALVRQLRARDKAADAAAASVATARHQRTAGAAAAAPARSAMVQAQLRQCPRANTPAGLRCRQKVCAKFSGRDPACPRS